MTYKPKILIIDNDYNSLIKFRLELLKRLQAFFEVIVLTHTDSKNNFNKYDIDILHFDISRSSLSLGNVIKEFKQIRKVISNKKPVIVLSFTTRCSFLNVMSNYYNNKIKIISVIAGLGNLFQRRDLKGKIVSLIVKKTISKSNLLIVLNNETLDFFNIKNSIMIPGEGVDLIRFRYQPRNRIRKYIFVGRLLKDKGILELVEAFKIVEKINPSLTLKLILSLDNDNPEQISLKDLEKMIGDNINIEINAKNVDYHLSQADCFVFPSYHEGFSIACSEAVSSGLPVIVSDIPGCRELCDNANGFLVEKKSVEHLKDAIIKMSLLNSEEVYKMSFNSRCLASNKLDQTKQSKLFFDIIVSQVN